MLVHKVNAAEKTKAKLPFKKNHITICAAFIKNKL